MNKFMSSREHQRCLIFIGGHSRYNHIINIISRPGPDAFLGRKTESAEKSNGLLARRNF